MLDKKKIQNEVEATLLGDKYTEGLGEIILEYADISCFKRGLYYRYNEFEIDFIIKPRIVDMLLLKVFKYDIKEASAYTYFNLITAGAINDAIRDLRRASKGESCDIYYIEDISRQVANMVDESLCYNLNNVYLDGDVIKLK